jgi:hypothetical protein
MWVIGPEVTFFSWESGFPRHPAVPMSLATTGRPC